MGGARSWRREKKRSCQLGIGSSVRWKKFEVIPSSKVLDSGKYGSRESPNKYLKGAANFDVWLLESSKSVLPGGGAPWTRRGRKLHWTMPKTNTADNRRQNTRQRTVPVFRFIRRPTEPNESCGTVSRLSPRGKECQQWHLFRKTRREQRGALKIEFRHWIPGEFPCAVTCYLSRMKRRCA